MLVLLSCMESCNPDAAGRPASSFSCCGAVRLLLCMKSCRLPPGITSLQCPLHIF